MSHDTYEDTADILDRAATIIEETSLAKGTYGVRDRITQEIVGVCGFGAVKVALLGDYIYALLMEDPSFAVPYDRATTLMDGSCGLHANRHLTSTDGWVQFNDHPHTTQADVVTRLREIATAERMTRELYPHIHQLSDGTIVTDQGFFATIHEGKSHA